MPGTHRKNHTGDKNLKQKKLKSDEDSEGNHNDNHVAMNEPSRTTQTLTTATKKVVAQFEEDQDVVNMELEEKIDQSDGDNDNEQSSDESDVENQNSQDENGQEDEDQNDKEESQDEQSEATQSESSESEDTEAEENLNHRDKRHKADKGPARKQRKKSRRKSMQNQIETLTSTVLTMQDLITRQGLSPKENPTKHVRSEVHKVKGKQNLVNEVDEATNSEVTIYRSAVRQDKSQNIEIVDPEVSFKIRENNNESSSSEEKIDTSDKLMEVDIPEQFIADCERQARQDEQNRREAERNNFWGHNK